MAKLSYKERLERMARDAKKLEKAKIELAQKMGVYILDNDSDVINITGFKEKYSKLIKNSDLLEEFEEYIKAKEEAEKVKEENQNQVNNFPNDRSNGNDVYKS